MTTRFHRTTLTALTIAAATVAAPAHAVLMFDQNVTPDLINGTGIANGSFTVDRVDGVELGLRGKLRHNAVGAPENTFNSNGDGTYSFDAGQVPSQAAGTAEWSFEWSINTDYDGSTSLNLDDFTYALALDTDPSLGVSFGALLGGLSNPFDPINGANPGTGGTVQWDHAIGDNTTPNGGGTSISNGVSDATGYAALIAGNNVAQQSWKPHWFIDGFNPNVQGIYDIRLSAFDRQGLEVASVTIQVETVPEPATLALLGLGLAGFAGAARRRRR